MQKKLKLAREGKAFKCPWCKRTLCGGVKWPTVTHMLRCQHPDGADVPFPRRREDMEKLLVPTSVKEVVASYQRGSQAGRPKKGQTQGLSLARLRVSQQKK